MTGRELFRLLLAGGPGFCQIALTNACNAHCRFCRFSRVPPREQTMADPDRLLAGLALLSRQGVRYLSFTGGEPLLHPALWDILEGAGRLGFTTLLVTNGHGLHAGMLPRLWQAGLRRLIISVDAADPAVHDAHRGLPGLAEHIRTLAPLAARAGLNPTASVTLSRLVGDLREMAASLKAQGFAALTFSYPLTRLHSPYLGYAQDAAVDFSRTELNCLFDRLLALKADPPLPILNTRWGLQELKRRLQGQRARLPCLAGYKFFFIDWHLGVYRCHYLGQRLGRLEDFPRLPPVRQLCAACLSECYLDASAYQQAAVSLGDAREAWRRGDLRGSLAAVAQPGTFKSLATLWEGRRWLRQHHTAAYGSTSPFLAVNRRK
jgi:MoaA/NifB/PqqE/SkfB family radical SAM enzyme